MLPVSYHKLLKRISPVLQSLHWLKIEQRIVYKLISLTYTALQHKSPSYLANKLELQSNRCTRSASVITLRRPPVKLETGKRSFSSAAPFLCGILYLQESASLLLTHSLPHMQHNPVTLISTNNSSRTHIHHNDRPILISMLHGLDLYIVTRTFDFEHAFTDCRQCGQVVDGSPVADGLVGHYCLDFILAPVSQLTYLLTYLLRKPSDPCVALQLKCTMYYRGP